MGCRPQMLRPPESGSVETCSLRAPRSLRRRICKSWSCSSSRSSPRWFLRATTAAEVQIEQMMASEVRRCSGAALADGVRTRTVPRSPVPTSSDVSTPSHLMRGRCGAPRCYSPCLLVARAPQERFSWSGTRSCKRMCTKTRLTTSREPETWRDLHLHESTAVAVLGLYGRLAPHGGS